MVTANGSDDSVMKVRLLADVAPRQEGASGPDPLESAILVLDTRDPLEHYHHTSTGACGTTTSDDVDTIWQGNFDASQVGVVKQGSTTAYTSLTRGPAGSADLLSHATSSGTPGISEATTLTLRHTPLGP